MVHSDPLFGLNDVSTAAAYTTVTEYLEPDYVSGSGMADIFPHMGTSSLTLPIFAVINLRTAVLLYYGVGTDISSTEIMAAVGAANTP